MGVANLFDEYLSFVIRAARRKWDKDIIKKHLFRERVDKNTLGEFYIKINRYNDARKEMFRRNKQYLKMLKERLERLGKKVMTVNVITDSRLLCDASSPFLWIPDELGLAWDPILDVTLIPSTEIKGAIAAVIEFEKSKELRDILFGGTLEEFGDVKSLVDLTDAYPIDSIDEILERDVMTPIYAKEIEEHKASPTPVNFYVIKRGVKFRFLVLIDKSRLERLLENKNYRELLKKVNIDTTNINTALNFITEKLKDVIQKAFERWGIGAKTSSGYGIFKIVNIGEHL